MRKHAGVKLLCSLIGVVACAPTEPPAVELTYYEHAAAILNHKCATCHSGEGIAPFRLDSYDDAFAARALIRTTVASGSMPPWQPAHDCQNYHGDYSLSADEVQTLTAWVDGGAAAGTPQRATRPDEPVTTQLSRQDLVLTMPTAYTPQLAPDDYRCFILDWDGSEDSGYVTGFRAIPGNLSVVHHVIAYLLEPDQVGAALERDQQDEQPGYRCFGGPSDGSGVVQWIGAWAPGGLGADFPEGTGMKVSPGAKIVLQLHYNVSYSAPAPDQTSVALRLDAEVEKEASILLWLDYRWPRHQTMLIPAGESMVVHSFVDDPTGWLPFLSAGAFAVGESFKIYSVGMHMHELGTRAQLWLEQGGTDEQCLLSLPKWDFAWQQTYRLQDPILVQAGDKLGIRCEFDNSRERISTVDGEGTEPYDSNWGDGTRDEMCLGILYIAKP